MAFLMKLWWTDHDGSKDLHLSAGIPDLQPGSLWPQLLLDLLRSVATARTVYNSPKNKVSFNFKEHTYPNIIETSAYKQSMPRLKQIQRNMSGFWAKHVLEKHTLLLYPLQQWQDWFLMWRIISYIYIYTLLYSIYFYSTVVYINPGIIFLDLFLA